jgi:arabinogalactan endo-1,4-beta-galactosidase
MNDISERYDKDVAVFETAYGFTLEDADGHPNIFGPEERDKAGYPASVQGQADLLYDVFKAVAEVPNNRGLGVFYWEPTWLGVEGAGWIEGEGNAWENQAMFDFEGNALDSLYVFGGIVEPVVVGYKPVKVQTELHVKPKLPEIVTVRYSDGSFQNVKVTWESINEEAYQNEGSFSVMGKVEGTSKPVIATITVKPI